MKTVIVSVTNDLVTDQRVHKVCTTLQQMGFSIHLVGRKLKNSLPIERSYKVTRMKLLFTTGALFYAEYNLRLFFFLLFQKKDVFLSNDLDTLLANYWASVFANKPIVYDSHELFTEVPELVSRPKIQKIWLAIEQMIFPKLEYVFTVCQSIADYYENRYGVSVKVVRNIPSNQDEDQVVDKTDLDVKKFISNKKSFVYQGAVNLGRGLFVMIDAVKAQENAVLVIFGDGDVFNEVEAKIKKEKLGDKVLLYGRIDPQELVQMTPLFDVGFSLEEDFGLNYRYALPNKIFDYLNAGIPSIVSDLPEMKNLVQKYQIGEVNELGTLEGVKEKIQKVLSSLDVYKENISLAKKELSWERESKVLQKVYGEFL